MGAAAASAVMLGGSSGATAAPAAPAAPVLVPETGYTLSDMYSYAHGAGLLVSVPNRVSFDAVAPGPLVNGTSPAPDTIVAAGSAVTLTGLGAAADMHAARAPQAPLAHRSGVTVPRFVGGGLGRVERWAYRTHRHVTITLGPLRDADGRSLYSDYRVAAQSVAPGSRATGRIVVTAKQVAASVGRPAGQAPAPCSAPAGWQITQSDGTALLMTHPASGSSGVEYGGCDLTTNRLFRLDSGLDLSDVSRTFGDLMLAGRFAGASFFALSTGQGISGTTGSCDVGYVVVDLASGSAVHGTSQACNTSLPDGGVKGVRLRALSPDGYAAYTANGGDGNPCPSAGCTEDLWAADGVGSRMIDSAPPPAAGAPDPFTEVSISGNTLSWINDGAAKTAALG